MKPQQSKLPQKSNFLSHILIRTSLLLIACVLLAAAPAAQLTLRQEAGRGLALGFGVRALPAPCLQFDSCVSHV